MTCFAYNSFWIHTLLCDRRQKHIDLLIMIANAQQVHKQYRNIIQSKV